MKNININWRGVLLIVATLIFAYYVPDAPKVVGGTFDDALNALLAKV